MIKNKRMFGIPDFQRKHESTMVLLSQPAMQARLNLFTKVVNGIMKGSARDQHETTVWIAVVTCIDSAQASNVYGYFRMLLVDGVMDRLSDFGCTAELRSREIVRKDGSRVVAIWLEAKDLHSVARGEVTKLHLTLSAQIKARGGRNNRLQPRLVRKM